VRLIGFARANEAVLGRHHADLDQQTAKLELIRLRLDP
jgi:hypothetical protein